jgi:hypothetical protein
MLVLMTNDGKIIQRLTYDDEDAWPRRADGMASSLEAIDLSADLTSAANYRSSREVGGSPGQASSSPATMVVINELLASPAAGGSDFVELHNRTDQPVDISGWYLTDSSNDILAFAVPADTVLESGGFLAIDQSQFGFGINGALGEQLVLISADSDGRPQLFVDVVDFGASQSGVTLGRWPDGQGVLFPMKAATLGQPNAGPLGGSVIVSEINYQPKDPDGDGALRREDFEYVEIYNRSDESVDLSAWRINGDVQYVFSSNTQLAAGESLVVVAFDPKFSPVLVSAFGLTYSIAPSTQLVGPSVGVLDNVQGTLKLERPTTSIAEEQPGWILVDRVDFAAQAPWPSGIEATGHSLHRVSASSYGNLASSWLALSGSPGRVQFSAGLPGDVTFDGKVDVADVDQLCRSLLRGEQNTLLDVNTDGRVDLADFQELVIVLLGSRPGDANLNGVFDSSDLVTVFATAEYEDAIAGNSTWSDGDWNCDGDFTTDDLIAAFVHGAYSTASRSFQATRPLGPMASVELVAVELPPEQDHALMPSRPFTPPREMTLLASSDLGRSPRRWRANRGDRMLQSDPVDQVWANQKDAEYMLHPSFTTIGAVALDSLDVIARFPHADVANPNRQDSAKAWWPAAW